MRVSRLMNLLVGVVTVTMILMMGYQPVVAAPPTGEVKTVAANFGRQIPVPRLDGPQANDWIQLLYDHLVGTTEDLKLSPEKGLANNWEMSRDGLTWTFYLRKGVKFHDGIELTAKDIKFSIEQLMLPDSVASNARIIREVVKNIEVRDPYTVVIQCKKSFLFLAHFLSDIEGMDTMIIPKDYYERVGKDGFQKRPIGSGPYKWHSQMLGSFIKLEATGEKHWRDGVPKFKYMTYLLIPEESTQIAMLKTGEADIAQVSRNRVKEVMDGSLRVVPKRGSGILVFYPNMQWTSPVFSDIRFRKALNFAIDKEAIRKHLLAGQGTPVATLPGDVARTCGGNPALKPYPYDFEEAKRLIKEGRYEGYEFGVPVFDRSGFPEFPEVAETVVGYWQKVGLKPKIFMTEWNAWREKWRTQKSENTIMGVDSSAVSGCNGILRTFEQKLYSKSELTHVKIPYLDERFEKIFKSLDLAEVEKLMGEMYRYTYDNYLVVPICDLDDIIATTKKIPPWDPGLRRRDLNFRGLIRQE